MERDSGRTRPECVDFRQNLIDDQRQVTDGATAGSAGNGCNDKTSTRFSVNGVDSAAALWAIESGSVAMLMRSRKRAVSADKWS